MSGLGELVYHWNVRTPYWLGFIFQRPESHCVHHQEGVHSSNYSDLPIWDMLFGTFRNPRDFDARCGLGDGEHRLGSMLAGLDVSAPRSAA
jgi:sterol desaturase/sphingolipid hydroxylase (fatty acid hydroxylase superfamily)